MTWDKGCQLASANKSGITTSYKYDYNGIRTEKTIDGVKTEYFYVGSTLMSQKSGNNVMNFYYNADGSPYGFTLNGTPYYYILNLQGDVIGIYNGNGTVIVSYVYNSWGKLLSITGTGYYIGLNNPLRYRGYVYDTETELYYLQSRYYDPETGRFISADSLLVAGDSINGTNMFAYCCNNPVCYYDPSGAEEEGVLQLPASSSTGSLLVGLVLGLSIGVVVLGLKVCRILIEYVEQAVSKPKHDTRVLDDVKIKKIDQGKHYQSAVILDDGTLMKSDSKYTFVEILALIGIANATYDITARYSPGDIAKPKDVLGPKWGVYADSQEAAKALAVVFGYEKAPEVHDNWYYGHYHVVKGKNHILHIWYGQPIDYSLL